MNLIEALTELAKGKKIRRKDSDKSSYIYLDSKSGDLKDNNEDRTGLLIIGKKNIVGDSYELFSGPLSNDEKHCIILIIRNVGLKPINITKTLGESFDIENIIIKYEGKEASTSMEFEKGTMFVGMSLDKTYTMKDLDIDI